MIDLISALKDNNIQPKGVIHVGGHKAQEYEEYKDAGLINQIWIEGNPHFHHEIISKIGEDKNVLIFNELIYDIEKEVKFGLANNGASSSILPLKVHKKYYPNIQYDGYILKTCKRLDNLMNDEKVDLSLYNGLVMDVQGVELNVIKSFGDNIKNLEFILSEVNVEELYEGCCLIEELDSYMKSYGFERIITDMWDDGAVGWGDALYIKK
jgi:hypothetical protein